MSIHSIVNGVVKEIRDLEANVSMVDKSITTLYSTTDLVDKKIFQHGITESIDHVELWIEGDAYWRNYYWDSSGQSFGTVNWWYNLSEINGKAVVGTGGNGDAMSLNYVYPGWDIAIGGHFYAILKDDSFIKMNTLEDYHDAFRVSGTFTKTQPVYTGVATYTNAQGSLLAVTDPAPALKTLITFNRLIDGSTTQMSSFNISGFYTPTGQNNNDIRINGRCYSGDGRVPWVSVSISDMVATYNEKQFPVSVFLKIPS